MRTADEQIIEAFAAVARPIMLRWMIPNSCIGATRLIQQTLASWRVPVEPITTNLIIDVKELKYAFLAGHKDKRAEAEAAGATWIDRDAGPCVTPWSGHMIGLACGRYLIDATIDQGSSPEHGVTIDPCVFTGDIGPEAGASFKNDIGSELHLTVATDNGIPMEIRYERTDDRTFETSEAWNDEGLPILAIKIVLAMHDYIRKGTR